MMLDPPVSMSQERVSPAPTVVGPRSIGEALRLLRHRARTSRDRLAARAGVSTGAISNYENDVSVPPAPTLRRMCRELGELLDESPAELWQQLGILLDQFSDRSDRSRR